MDRKIFFHPERCMFCLSCVLACETNSLGLSDVHHIPWDGSPCQRLTVTFHQGTPWAWTCQHCLSAPCVEACINGSLGREEGEYRITHRPESCVGCGSCLLVCPYGALIYDEKEEKVHKCNLCPEREIPPCVKACQSKALVCHEPSHFAREKGRRFAQEMRRGRERE